MRPEILDRIIEVVLSPLREGIERVRRGEQRLKRLQGDDNSKVQSSKFKTKTSSPCHTPHASASPFAHAQGIHTRGTFKLQTSNFKLQTLLLFVITLLMSSCLKEEDPVTPPDLQGDVQTAQIPMGAQYEKQYYFDLSKNQIVSSNLKTDWDLAFECGVDGYRIVLNSSKLMFAWNTGSKVFEDITRETGAFWKWDVASGNLDSTGIGAWGEYANGKVVSEKNVYVIDRGKYFNTTRIGYKKIVFESLENNSFTIRYANLDGSEEDTLLLEKNEDYAFVYFSFENGGEQVTIAPEKTAWDLVFTQYTHIFSETPENIPQPDTLIPYIVTGVLLNNYEVIAEKEFTKPFANITFDDAVSRQFTDQSNDIIGYLWKYFNFEEITYTVFPEKIYIIRDTEGYLYKLHFIDFYSNTGERGFPKFEFQRL